MRKILVATSVLIFWLAGVGWAAVWYVTPSGSDMDSGRSWDQAVQTIQAAVARAKDFDDIWVQEGTYLLDTKVAVKKAVAIYGGFKGTESQLGERDCKENATTVSGNHMVSCFEVHTDATIDGFTIINGKSDFFAGGVTVGSLSSPTIANCTFHGNSSRHGGAIYNSSGSSATIVNCIFRANGATHYHGGAICNYYRSSPLILNCIFHRNAANGHGGGIYNCGSSPIVTNCTFFGNEAGSNGGAICNYFYSSPAITNCVFWEDYAPHGPEIDSSVRSIPAVTYSNIQGGYPGPGNMEEDPEFVDPHEGDFHLSRWSVCMDAGDLSAPYMPIVDFEGDPRVSGEGPDLGADEVAESLIEVHLDVKPQSCSNRLNVKSKGVLPVAIVSTDSFDATMVDPVTVELEGVSPVRWSEEDVATPVDRYLIEDRLDCTTEGRDGYVDLTLKFKTQEIVAALGEVYNRECRVLRLTGEDFDGRPVVGEDLVVIIKNK